MTGKTPPTADKLRIAIDREGQADKVNFPDPAAAPLGTDEEASGHPPSREELAMEPIAPGGRPRTRWGGAVLYAVIAAVVFGGILALALTASGAG